MSRSLVRLYVQGRAVIDADIAVLDVREESEQQIMLAAHSRSVDLRDVLRKGGGEENAVDVHVLLMLDKSLAWLRGMFTRRARVESMVDEAVSYCFTGKGGTYEAVKEPEGDDQWCVVLIGKGPIHTATHDELTRERAIEVAYNLAHGWTESGNLRSDA